MMFDGSLIQIEYDFIGQRLKKHRLCYYPCPIILDYKDSGFDNDLDYIEEVVCLKLFDEVSNLVEKRTTSEIKDGEDFLHEATKADTQFAMRTPIRFDFDEDSAGTNHSASHMHMSHYDCRIPVFGPISVGHFIRFIFRHFYPKQWDSNTQIQASTVRYLSHTIARDECNDLYLDWKE